MTDPASPHLGRPPGEPPPSTAHLTYPHRVHVSVNTTQREALALLSARTGQSAAYIARAALVAYLRANLPPELVREDL